MSAFGSITASLGSLLEARSCTQVHAVEIAELIGVPIDRPVAANMKQRIQCSSLQSLQTAAAPMLANAVVRTTAHVGTALVADGAVVLFSPWPLVQAPRP